MRWTLANIILTPVTLWKDFDESLPLDEEEISREEADGLVCREVYYYGRKTEKGRVKIFARFVAPAGAEEYPAVMMLFEAGLPADMNLVKKFTSRGYAVLCVDYCGDDGTETFTVYPEDVDYANYARAGRAMEFADRSAKETSWYEWAAVARYSVKYLHEMPQVTSVGAIGIRTGGEILWKIAPYSQLSCIIPVCAAGWLAYRDLDKFGEKPEKIFDEERHRFIAGVDSQSYAPYVKCPVLLLCAINDRKNNYDRAYDTFQRINPDVEKAILFSSRGNGLMGSHTMVDLNLFLDKYLKGRSVFVSGLADVSVGEDEEGNLVAKCKFDEGGEIVDCGIFFTEEISDCTSREWTRLLADEEQIEDNACTVPFSVYAGSEKALVYSFVNYSNGFSVTSKIKGVPLTKKYRNTVPRSRVIYDRKDGLNGFTPYRQRTRAVADCFVDDASAALRLLPGYGGITGISCELGLITFRVGEPRYAAPDGANLQFDVYAERDTSCKAIFVREEEGEKVLYTADFSVSGGGKWKKELFAPEEFKSDTGAPLSDFTQVDALIFLGEGKFVLNNIIWL